MTTIPGFGIRPFSTLWIRSPNSWEARKDEFPDKIQAKSDKRQIRTMEILRFFIIIAFNLQEKRTAGNSYVDFDPGVKYSSGNFRKVPMKRRDFIRSSALTGGSLVLGRKAAEPAGKGGPVPIEPVTPLPSQKANLPDLESGRASCRARV